MFILLRYVTPSLLDHRYDQSGIWQGGGGHVPVNAASFANDNAPKYTNSRLKSKIPSRSEVVPLTGVNHKYHHPGFGYDV